jgi:hypothetical protein
MDPNVAIAIFTAVAATHLKNVGDSSLVRNETNDSRGAEAGSDQGKPASIQNTRRWQGAKRLRAPLTLSSEREATTACLSQIEALRRLCGETPAGVYAGNDGSALDRPTKATHVC